MTAKTSLKRIGVKWDKSRGWVFRGRIVNTIFVESLLRQLGDSDPAVRFQLDGGYLADAIAGCFDSCADYN